ncbi:hypothetical protein ACFWZ2_38740 [Streptomyces sp. NPDC059002]|uniref:hypothetical protein n=1 Tax=Streptomyces sp. NPDC059002 TaxID=3346690 RepID=UPI0036A3178B
MTAALDHLHDGDMPCVQEADRLGRNLLEGPLVLNDLFQRGIAVKVLERIAASEHTDPATPRASRPGEVRVAALASPYLETVRTPKLIRQSDPQAYLFNFFVGGEGVGRVLSP